MNTHSVESSVEHFASVLPFELDAFQTQALDAIAADTHVIACAPTGSGKTIIGEYAAYRAVAQGKRCIYTTPVKALSNQKMAQFAARFGPENVGLLTGDHSIHPEAPVVVMTTEVLRNMIYSSPHRLENVQSVVMDEVHYLGDQSRGVVWEEALISLPVGINIVGLSATIGNPQELITWLSAVIGYTELVESHVRAVPLVHTLANSGHLNRIYISQSDTAVTNPHVPALSRGKTLHERISRARRYGMDKVSRHQLVDILAEENLLPAIFFIFSRAGCDKAALSLARSSLQLTTPQQRTEIAARLATLKAEFSDSDLHAIDFRLFEKLTLAGVASHHAGVLPALKKAVEEMFDQGLLKVVCATETLAVGIHMPARCTVFESLTKFDGTGHSLMTATQYAQMAGRAGRRGLDSVGHSIIVDRRELSGEDISFMLSSPAGDLVSCFQPDYSMAVNLVRRYTLPHAQELLSRSFAQFQTNKDLKYLYKKLRQANRDHDRAFSALQQAGGDESFHTYMDLRLELSTAEKALATRRKHDVKAAVEQSLEELSRGDVIELPGSRWGRIGVVLTTRTEYGRTTLKMLGDRGRTFILDAHTIAVPPEPVGSLSLPAARSMKRKHFDHAVNDLYALQKKRSRKKSRRSHRGRVPESATAEKLRASITSLRKELSSHPLHGHERLGGLERLYRRFQVQKTAVGNLENTIATRNGELGRQLGRYLDILTTRDFLTPHSTDGVAGFHTTGWGEVLSHLRCQSPLAIAECLRAQHWHDLSTWELAAVVSILVTSARRNDAQVAPPSDQHLAQAIEHTQAVVSAISRDETTRNLDPSNTVDITLAPAIYQWCGGVQLADVLTSAALDGHQLTAGDFVSSVRNVVDVLGHIAALERNVENYEQLGLQPVVRTARAAITDLKRGVVTDNLG